MPRENEIQQASRRSITSIGVTALCCALVSGCTSYPSLDKLPSGLLLEANGRGLVAIPANVRAVSPDGLSLTKRSEGFVSHLYDDAAGYCTIGYGHLIQQVPCAAAMIPTEFESRITEPRGTNLLLSDLTLAETAVMREVRSTLSDAQYSALCDFVFNVGAHNFATSTLLVRLNQNRFDQVPGEIRRWRLSGGKVFQGLVDRREHEIALFLAGQTLPPPSDRSISSLTPVDIRTGETRP